MPTTEAQKKFALFLGTKEVSAWLSEFPVEGTKATYSSALYITERLREATDVALE